MPWGWRFSNGFRLLCLVHLYVRFQVLANASYQATAFCENPLLGAGFWTARITERYRAENAQRGTPGLTSLSSGLYLDLGHAYLRLSDTPHALAAFERGRALESAPDLLEELASVYRAAGDLRKAAMALVEALAVDPNRPELPSMLVELYGQIDPQGCAVTRQGGTPSLNPDCPLVHGDICAASRNVIGNYLRRGQQFEAAAIRKVAEQDLACDAGLLN